VRRIHSILALFVVLALVAPAAIAFPAGASPAPQEQAAEKKILTIDEYARFHRVVSTDISPDGQWVSYGYRKREADDALVFDNLDDERSFDLPRASNPRFSEDSRWAAYEIALPFDEIEKLEEDNDPVPVQVELLDLQSGDKIGPWDDISNFAFAKSSLALAVKRRREGDSGGGGGGGRGGRGGRGSGASGAADDDDAPRGTDLILRYLQGGYEELLGSVDEFAFNKAGTHLA